MAIKTKSSTAPPLISIIIVNWNGGEVFAGCLKSLSEISYPNWELIVVDNGSTDGSEKINETQISNHNLQIINNKKNLGFAKANNQGVELAMGKYILLLNNDTKVEPDFLSKLVKRVEEDPKVAVIQPKIMLMDKPGYLDNAGSFLTRIGFLQHWGFMEKDGPEFNQEKEIFSAKGACMLIRKEIIDKIALFDKDFFSYFEESDFCWRVWLAGYKVLFFPDAMIYHKVGFTIRRLNVLLINYHYYKNRICSLIKNLEGKNLILILIPHIFISMTIFGAFLFKGQFKNSFFIIKALSWNIVNLLDTLKKREKVKKIKVIKDWELFQKVLHPINWKKYLIDFKRIKNDLK